MRLTAFADDLRRVAITHDQDLFAAPELIATGKQTFAPSRRALLLELVRTGVLAWEPDIVDAIYAGLDSGAQHAFSVDRGDPAGWPDERSYVHAARADIVDAGKAPPYVQAVASAFRASGDPFGEVGTAEPPWPGRTVLFTDAATRALAPETANAASRIMAQVLPDHGLLASGSSGYELYDLGLWDDAATAIRATLTVLEGLGARTVVTDSPEAVIALTRFAPALGIRHQLEICHLATWLAARDFNSSTEMPATRATYHDSSRLGRGLGIYDEPRALLAAVPGLSLVEMQYRREEAIPSGPALGYPFLEAIPAMAERRLAEAMDTGASLVIVASPYSKRNLRLAAVPNPPDIRDLIDVLAGNQET
jgi:Fe-S oxidoreductase